MIMDTKYLLVIFLHFTIMGHIAKILASQYDPHPFPDRGPFVEGWYFRFIDFSQNRSFALLFGAVEPENPEIAEHLAFVGLLLDRSGERLQSIEHFPSAERFNITINGGRPVKENPDIKTPCDFTLNIATMGHVTVNSNRTEVDLVVDNVHFQTAVGAPVPWNNDGLGPAGWVQYFSSFLPLNWFVYSLRSPITSYRWTNLETGKVLSGNKGFVHMEKNWGDSFPKAWVWTEAVHQIHHEITYALAYGPLDFSYLEVTGFLFGYRNPHKGLTVDMTPANSWMSSSLTDGCHGSVRVTLTSLTYKIKLHVSGDLSTFSGCLFCPERNGFRQGSVETYAASTTVVIYKRNFLRYEEVDRQSFNGFAALEFGGTFMCKPCGM